MRRLFAALMIAAFATAAGCTWYDALFNVFDDSYSGGGATREEKRFDYDDRMHAYNSTP